MSVAECSWCLSLLVGLMHLSTFAPFLAVSHRTACVVCC